MRAIHVLSTSLACLGASLALAQVPAPPSAGPNDKAQASPEPLEQRSQTIQVEDTGARIDELRVGGETRSINVQPKGGMPAYDVVPHHGTRTPAGIDREGAAGSRVWKVLGF